VTVIFCLVVGVTACRCKLTALQHL